MTASVAHLEFLVEDRSMEVFLRSLLPRWLPAELTWSVHAYQGKPDLFQRLPDRLRGFANYLPDNSRIVVLVDCDDDECVSLRRKMDAAATNAGLRIRSAENSREWQIVNRIAVEELEAWYFGEWQAVCQAFPRLPSHLPKKASFRDPDAIRGGTWEAFERVLQKYGYDKTGLRKPAAARLIGSTFDAGACRSRSFQKLHAVIAEVTSP